MPRFRPILLLLLLVSATFAYENDFRDPPSQYGIRCWWWWLNSNVTPAAITRDLEAMHEKNFSGALIFDAGGAEQRGNRQVPAGPTFASPEWTALFQHALNEASRLDLELGLSIQSGWNLGGPDVPLDLAAKTLTWSETPFQGPGRPQNPLPTPDHRENYYRDIAVLAFPLASGNNRPDAKPIRDLPLKAAFREIGLAAPDCRFLLEDVPAAPDEAHSPAHAVRDLSAHLDPATGRLDADLPPGQWTILRFGYTYNGAHVSTHSQGWAGRVIDYLSPAATNAYLDRVVEPLLDAAGPHRGTTLRHLQTDSWECGGMNWTDDFPAQFRARRGYDILPWLPVIAGRIVQSRDASNAFLADFRKTIGESVAVHYRTFADFAHRHHLAILPESGGPHTGPFDAIKNYVHSDIVMSEFWSPSPHRPKATDRFYVKQAASVAHVLGKRLVAAEAFTTIGRHWNDVLWAHAKPAFDHELCAGLNLVYLHTFTCSPAAMGLPGQEYFAGTHFNPNVTWWPLADGFIDYMARCQALAQQGRFVADALYYYGDHVPNVARLKQDDPAGVLPQYDYDIINEDILLDLRVDQGRLTVPSGLHYRLLVLPDHQVLSLAALEKVDDLLRAGANVLGPKPLRLVSLQGGHEAQRRFHQLSGQLWGRSPADHGQKPAGQGQLFWNIPGRQALAQLDVAPDLVVENTTSETDYIHYTLEDGAHLYFITNQSPDPVDIAASFRVASRQPELWDPLTGQTRPAAAFSQSDDRTTLPLRFDPWGLNIVLFRNPIPPDTQGPDHSNFPDRELKPLQTLGAAWTLTFDPQWGPADPITLDTLIDWSTSQDAEIRHYSGQATYRTTFNLEKEKWGQTPFSQNRRYYLDLGQIEDVGIAQPTLNGRQLPILWTTPFRTEITQHLKPGPNTLEIEVINSWRNRLIGDRDLPESQRRTNTNITITKDWPLEPAGLLGPVKLLEIHQSGF